MAVRRETQRRARGETACSARFSCPQRESGRRFPRGYSTHRVSTRSRSYISHHTRDTGHHKKTVSFTPREVLGFVGAHRTGRMHSMKTASFFGQILLLLALAGCSPSNKSEEGLLKNVFHAIKDKNWDAYRKLTITYADFIQK